jgi:hypothetical protein
LLNNVCFIAKTLVAPVAVTRTWVPTSESQATQYEVVAILRKDEIASLTLPDLMRVYHFVLPYMIFTITSQNFQLDHWLTSISVRVFLELKLLGQGKLK